ncbi:RCC1 domain-containing protein [Streptomyces anulatus]|uniref:RCC1 domain-containing protein n=1 Tax=Streptomyces anulatus TaxID=1892 RepID=UPI00403DA353
MQSWGANGSGQLGDGSVFSHNAPGQVVNLANAADVAAGGTYSRALLADQTVVAWGHNTNGQLGDGTSANRNVASRASELTGVKLIAAGADHNLALVGGSGNGGVVMAWGHNATGQLGDGTTEQRNTPVSVTGLTGVQLVAGGREHTTALLSDNTVRSWGANSSGQLGDGTTTDSSTPVTTLTGLTGVGKIATATSSDFGFAN